MVSPPAVPALPGGSLRRLACHYQLHHDPLLAVGAAGVLAVNDLLAVVLELRDGPRDALLLRLAQGRAVKDDLLAVELVLAPAERHPRCAGVGPHAGERARGRLEADQPQAGRLRLALLEGERRLEEAPVV